MDSLINNKSWVKLFIPDKVAQALLAFVVALSPWLFLWAFSVGLLGAVLFAVSWWSGHSALGLIMIGLVFPLAVVWWWGLLSEFVANELQLAADVGEDEALFARYADGSKAGTINSLVKRPTSHMLIWGWDLTGPLCSDIAKNLGLSEESQQLASRGILKLGSRSWVRFMRMLRVILSDPMRVGALSMALASVIVRLPARGVSTTFKATRVTFLLAAIILALPAGHVAQGLYATLDLIVGIFLWVTGSRGTPEALEWLGWRITQFVTASLAWSTALNSEVKRTYSEKIAGGSLPLATIFRGTVIKTVKVIDDMALPSFVRTSQPVEYTRATLQRSMEVMKRIGLPVNVELEDPDTSIAGLSQYKEWVLCGSSMKQGILNLKQQVDSDLDILRVAGLQYKRAESYATKENELKSLSRYFKSVKYDYPDLPLSDVWEVVGEIFKDSKLTPFNYIISAWEKKYALGALMADPDNPNRKYKRSKFIKDVGGYSKFKEIWARAFHYAAMIVPVSAVSVKGEALPQKKWAADKVRTVVGSPIVQYIMSTVWNYGPNHRFAWETTPIKVGMPLNGAWIGRVFERHGRCQIHCEGDFSEFDSTVSSGVQAIIKEVRKKGYECHKDRDRICELIDLNYRQVENQLLNTTSTGNIYHKGTGLSTGHSSTTADNSLAVVILYLMAWRELTGLSAKEFKHFNELSCYGDDHELSILASRPMAWSPKNIQKTMARWGLTNNLEVKQLQDLEFLSKRCRLATAEDKAEMARLGLKCPRFIVWHNKTKLVGKMTCSPRNMNPTYRAKRLVSYLTLTAHHKDVYDQLVAILTKKGPLATVVKNNNLVIPTYQKVMADWYNMSGNPYRGEDEETPEAMEDMDADKATFIGSVTVVDSFLGALSLVPDLLNPSIFNFGYLRMLQVYLRARLSWVPDMLCNANVVTSHGMLAGVLKRTPYAFLDPSLFSYAGSGSNPTECLIRHWLFCAYISRVKPGKMAAFLEFVARKVAAAQFLLNGHVHSTTREWGLNLDRLLLVALLSFVTVPDVMPLVTRARLPDMAVLIDLAVNFVSSRLWNAVPASYTDVLRMVANHPRGGGPLLVSAPTGTGKSTGLIGAIGVGLGHIYTKVIVIEPRQILVKGLVSYMQDRFPLSVSGSTTGLDLDRSARVWYMTPQSFLMHLGDLSPHTLVVLDEAHVMEPAYNAVRSLLPKLSVSCIYVTATPPDWLNKQTSGSIALETASLYKSVLVNERKQLPGSFGFTPDIANALSDYESLILNRIELQPPGTKALYMVPTIKMVNNIRSKATRQVVPLSSEHPIPTVWTSEVYVGTPIVDVGITIPGLTDVVSSDFGWDSSAGRYAFLPAEVLKQRKGRTGRDVNGTFTLVQYLGLQLPLFTASQQVSADDWKALLFTGVPVEICAQLDKVGTLRALGLDMVPIPEERWEDVLRAAHIFLKNAEMVTSSHLKAQIESVGSPDASAYVLTDTGAGHVSSSYPQDGSAYATEVIDQLAATVNAGLGYSSLDTTPQSPLTQLANKAGSYLDFKSLALALASDLKEGWTDMRNRKLVLPIPGREQMEAMAEIHSLLDDIERLA